jgi:predicted MFS family arabinose efflux permease
MMSISRVTAWIVWGVASIFYAYQYVLRVMPNIMLDDIMAKFQIDAAIFGQFSGIYYIGYSLMHLPIGIMLDRHGPRKVMSGCILLTVIGLLPLLFADHFIYPIVGRALIGMGSSAAILGAFKIIRMTFQEKQFTRMLSFSATIGLIGAIYGGSPISYLSETFGYQFVVQFLALVGIGLALLTYIIVPEMDSVPTGSILKDIKEVLSNRRVIWCSLLAGLMVGPLEGFADVWGSAFLTGVYRLEHSQAVTLPSMIFIGMCFGSPLLSVIAEKTGHYIGTIMGAGFIMAISFAWLLTGALGSNSIALLFLLVGVCCGYQIIAIYQASTYVDERVAGLTTALANMIIMSFGYAFHSLIGLVVKFFGGSNQPISLLYGVGVIPILLTVGVIGFLVLWLKPVAVANS